MKLIINLGAKYITFSVFSTNSHERLPVLLDFIVQDIENKNMNLISRTIQRVYNEICTHYQLDSVVIVPRRSSVTTQPLRLEYLNDAKAMKKKLLEQVNLPGNPGEYITDWTVQDDNPEQDYQQILVTSIRVDEFKFISETMKLVGERRYKIASPFCNLGVLFPENDMPYLLLQMGHQTTDMYIVKNGICVSYRQSNAISGIKLSNVILTTGTVSYDELYKFKNNATYYDLESANAVSEFAVFLSGDVTQFIQDYNDVDNTPIAGYTVIGGIANLDFETFTSMVDMTVPRYYPKLPIANHKQIVDNLRNYMFESACLVLEDETATNFTAPKDKSIGQYIKTLTSIYAYAKVPLFLLVFAIVLSIGSNYVQNTMLEEKINSEQIIVNNYQSEVESIKSTITLLQQTYDELLDDKQLAIVNYGETLATLSKVIPQGTFLTEIVDITSEYLPESSDSLVAPIQTDPNTLPESNNLTGTVNGLEVNTVDMLVALEVRGYTNQSVKAYDYALLLKEVYKDAVVTNVVAEGDIYNFELHVVIDK